MTRTAAILLAAVAAAFAAGGGYWAGTRQHGGPAEGDAAPAAPGGERKPLYYRNPMGLPDTSPVPKKDPMGMDYIPVYAGEDPQEADSGLRISPEKIQKLGVRTEAAQLRALSRSVRAAGRIEPDERRIHAVSPRFEGYVERLFVNATGQPVGRGQPLFEVYSPELVSAQREYAIAAQGAASLPEGGGMKQLADAALQRLKNWEIPDDQIKSLARSGEAKRTLVFRSPAAGIVTEKKAVQGMRFGAGEALYQIVDLSSVWVVADVFEQDLAAVRPGAVARVRIDAYPDKVFEGKVAYVYPTLKAETRTVPVRVELPNPGGLLKPGLFAQVELPAAGPGGQVVTVPASAVIDSGRRQIVLVQSGEGRFEPREVKLGARGDDVVEVREGVRAGEPVVVAANFLIDAESNLKAAVTGFTPPPAAASAGHRTTGKVDAVDAAAGTVTVSHAPVASLKWPAMTMDFAVANSALMKELKPGTEVEFEFVERGAGEWVITKAGPVAGGAGHAHR